MDYQKSNIIADKAMGAMMGQATGDALGTTLEFSHVSNAPKWPERMKGPHTEIIGEGPFRLAAGQVTDDTHLACCIAASLVEHDGFDAKDIADRYVEWREHTFDIGGTTIGGIRGYQETKDPRMGGYLGWHKSGRSAAGNGSLMRTSPLGVFYADEEDEALVRLASLQESAITHAHPYCTMACAAFNSAIACGVKGGTRQEMWRAAWNGLRRAVVELGEFAKYRRENVDPTIYPKDPEIVRCFYDLQDDLTAARDDDPKIERPNGFVRTSFRLAFYQLLHAESFEDGLLDTVNRGGDSDTNGAIAGALLGAYFGLNDIPERWAEAVETCKPVRGEVFATKYHPQHLFYLAEHVCAPRAVSSEEPAESTL